MEEKFKGISIDQKRKDLSVHPMVNHERIKDATDAEIEQVYHALFSSFDMAMQEVLGESIFDDEW